MNRVYQSWSALYRPLLVVSLVMSLSFPFPCPGMPVGSRASEQAAEPIKIGVLITSDTAGNALTKQAVDALQMAVGRVNASGGILGKSVETVIKSVEGNWGSGSKRSVGLIYEDQVRAILGFVDGRSAHLIEQVCTKAQVPFLSAYSPDPTLSRINIPWFFSAMPHAEKQSNALVEEIYGRQKKRVVTVISSDDYDVRFLTGSFVGEAVTGKYPAPSVLTYPSGQADFKELVTNISWSDTEALVFFGSSEEWVSLFPEFSRFQTDIPVFTPIMEWENSLVSRSAIPVFTTGSQNRDAGEWSDFREIFYEKHGYRPGILAAYVYDATNALLESIKRNGEESTEIQKGLSALNVKGINGRIVFDSSGMIMGELNINQVN